MGILEIGKDKKYKTISAAILDAEDGDEIRIYPGFYNEVFDCMTDLIFTGVPSDIKDFSTYPQIYNGDENQFTNIVSKCEFSNIIFTANDSVLPEEFRKICSDENLDEEIIQKYRREELENSHKEVFCLVVENGSRFENCHFIGGRNYGVVVDLNNTKIAPEFSNCGFYLNYYAGIYVTGKKSSPTAVFNNCKVTYNGNGVYGGNFNFKECDVHHNQSNGVLFYANESKLEQCNVYSNGCGIAGQEKGSLSINETDIHTSYSEGINLGGNAKLLVNKSKIHINKEAAILSGKSNFLAVECEIKNNNGDAILCTENSELTLQTCVISENIENGIEATDKSKISVFESRILNNGWDGLYAGKKSQIKLRDSDFIGNRNGAHFKGQAEGIVNTCAFASNADCDFFVTDASKCEVEKSKFITKQLPEQHKKNERAVAVLCADKTEARFKECQFSSQKTKDTILAILMGEADGYFSDCDFQDAENGIVVYNQSGCNVKKCKFTNCFNLDIYHKSKLTSWVDVKETDLSEATKKDLSVKDYEIARKLLPELNDEEKKIISMYYNLDSENPDEEYRLTAEEVALYFNIPVKRVERAFNRLAELSEE